MTTSSEAHPLLDVKDLQALLPTQRGLVRAVDNVSFSLCQGRTLGIERIGMRQKYVGKGDYGLVAAQCTGAVRRIGAI